MFSDDEDDDPGGGGSEWAFISKVLSPSALHINTIWDAMKPAWGNPYGLKMRSVGENLENLFIAEFGMEVDKQHVLDGSLWIVGLCRSMTNP